MCLSKSLFMSVNHNTYPKEILQARVPSYNGLQCITIDSDGLVSRISTMSRVKGKSNQQSLDIQGDWISLGGVDLQINGALGLAFPDLTSEHIPKLEKICTYLWEQGVDAFLPTLVTTSIEKIQRSLAVIDHFMQHQSPYTANILGVHLEGPFLNPAKKGAHPQEYLLPLTLENIQLVLGSYSHIVKVMTLAPELDPNGRLVAYLNSLGITVSLGHSLANSEQAMNAFGQGARMVTHAFNAMPPLHHRNPGLLAAAISHPEVYCGLIADGQHVHPLVVEMLIKASGGDRGVFLVSDALAPLGLVEGVYPWDDREIIIKSGTARLVDGTLAGTTLPLLSGVENLVRWGICDIGEAIALATLAPRAAIAPRNNGKKNHPYIGQHVSRLLRWSSLGKKVTWQRFCLPSPILQVH